ncbi:MAG: DNA polymerase III subunit gamma/tau [Ruminococcus sp.]|nr:DNA polymerase III subunit gamma/tau [Ruminococcus sp.]
MYKALYRKWRPQTFDDVISQSHVTDTLKNQIKSGKTAHAYLFTGSRGTGKTTCARIFAKALCCLNSIDGNPCLECELCKDTENSKVSDIIEIDAASNNSVEDIRDLRDGAVYLPERCKYKIYIIDEVHMLSTSAFNALLKIMEEPPEFVKFILATTEIHKVPATILSRCQRFDFKRILPEDISKRLLYIAEHEDFTLTKEASFLIAKLSDGGMRDAISLLDQSSAFSDNITEDVVSSAMGIAGREYLFDALDYLFKKDIAKLFELVDLLYMQSKDLAVFCSDIISQIRNVMVLKVAPSQVNTLACMPSELERLTELSKSLSLKTIIYYMDSLEVSYNRLLKSSNRRIELELSFANVCSGNSNSGDSSNVAISSQMNTMISNLLERIDSLESRVNNSNVPMVANTSNVVKHETNVQLKSEFSKLNLKDFKPLQEWQTILNELNKVNPGMYAVLDGSKAIVNQGYILILAEKELFVNLLKQQDNYYMLRSIIDRVLGGHYKIMAKKNKTNSSITNNSVQNVGLDSAGFKNLIDRANELNIPTKQID